MEPLTPRQAKILQLVRDAIEANGYPPTRAEICRAMGFSSPNAAEEHLRALERKGAIEMLAGASRGIRLKAEQGLPLIGRVAAGSPMLAEANVQAHYRVDPALFKPRADYLLKVRGLSMRDAGILDGDLLAVHSTQEARSGQDRRRAAARRSHGQALQAPRQPGAVAAREPGFQTDRGRPAPRRVRDRRHRVGVIRNGTYSRQWLQDPLQNLCSIKSARGPKSNLKLSGNTRRLFENPESISISSSVYRRFLRSRIYTSPRTTGEFVRGSPLNALLVEPPFQEYHFIDLNSKKVEILKKLTGPSSEH